jgi:enoyl-CoA hydratase/carnithine racemase
VAGELIVERAGPIVRLTLNRPAQRNAVTPELVEEALAAFDGIDADPEVRVVALTGASTAFCAGFDITRIDSASAAALSPSACALGSGPCGSRSWRR